MTTGQLWNRRLLVNPPSYSRGAFTPAACARTHAATTARLRPRISPDFWRQRLSLHDPARILPAVIYSGAAAIFSSVSSRLRI
jgi:hypothetical protein